MKFFAFAAAVCLFLCSFSTSAQDAEKDAKFYAQIEEWVTKYSESLQLEDWQAFYADSILVHNVWQRGLEIKELQDAKVSNQDLYFRVADKWDEATYQAFRKILTDEQWVKYNKKWAGKAKKERDKRAAKL